MLKYNDNAKKEMREVINSLKTGDIAYYLTSKSGNISSIYKLFDVNKKDTYGRIRKWDDSTKGLVNGANDKIQMQNERRIYAKLEKVVGSYILYDLGEIDPSVSVINAKNLTGKICDVDLSSGKVYVDDTLTLDDLMPNDNVFIVGDCNRVSFIWRIKF